MGKSGKPGVSSGAMRGYWYRFVYKTVNPLPGGGIGVAVDQHRR